MKIPILMYHQIDEPPPRGTPLRGLTVAPSSFKRQMWILKLLGYQGLSMRDLEPYLFGEKEGKVVGITFDDGYQNNVVHALPVLKRHGFTATCYAVSQRIGGTNDWDADKGVQKKPLMNLSDWKTWLHAGMDVGSHTRNHADLTQLSDAEAETEINLPKRELEQLLNCEVRHFCYPYGKYEDKHLRMCQLAGYISATTTHRGIVMPSQTMYVLPRVLIARATSWLQFCLKILTQHENQRHVSD